MSDFNFLMKTLTYQKGEPNEKYFRPAEEDGEYKYTEYFKYKLAQQAKEYFKELIIKMDDPDNPKYTKLASTNLVDEERTKEVKAQYAKQSAEYNRLWKDYKDNHTDEFIDVESIDSFDAVSREVGKFFVPDMSISIDDAFQGYVCANNLSKYYGKGGDGYEQLPKMFKKMSKDDFKDAHAKFKENLRTKLGLPKESEMTVKFSTMVRGLKRMSSKDNIVKSTEAFEEFTKQFTEFILEE